MPERHEAAKRYGAGLPSGPVAMPSNARPEETLPRRDEPPSQTPCDVCGGPTYEARCKVICRRCGYTRDCSDP